jgi:hypothetical protein
VLSYLIATVIASRSQALVGHDDALHVRAGRGRPRCMEVLGGRWKQYSSATDLADVTGELHTGDYPILPLVRNTFARVLWRLSDFR